MSDPMQGRVEKTVNILGIRGLPAAHGGFETFAAKLAPYLRSRGWNVNVYCQVEFKSESGHNGDFEDDWQGIRRIHRWTRFRGSAGSIIFDLRSILHVLRSPGVDLILGYNTAALSIIQRLFRRKILMNMDGIEWRRAKWNGILKVWFYVNEFIGYRISSTVIADHPEIATHLQRHGVRDVVVIPYGGDQIDHAPATPLSQYGLNPSEYLVCIARWEPENSIYEIVSAFSKRRRGVKLAVLGKYIEGNEYHDAVREAASDEVVFLGAIYDGDTVAALRFHALAYLHGHRVGGTNPSLVEALGAGNPVIAHRNVFNHWVAGADQAYFSDVDELDTTLTQMLNDQLRLKQMQESARTQHDLYFQWEKILKMYEAALYDQLHTHSREQ